MYSSPKPVYWRLYNNEYWMYYLYLRGSDVVMSTNINFLMMPHHLEWNHVLLVMRPFDKWINTVHYCTSDVCFFTPASFSALIFSRTSSRSVWCHPVVGRNTLIFLLIIFPFWFGLPWHVPWVWKCPLWSAVRKDRAPLTFPIRHERALRDVSLRLVMIIPAGFVPW